MRAVVQRVTSASVTVAGETVGQISHGLLVLLGVAKDDREQDVVQLAQKLIGLRVFDDEAGKMNLDVVQVSGAMLIVSQFTLLADCRKGRRPSYTGAAPPQLAESFYEAFITAVSSQGVPVETGRFGAMMDVALVNDGPVTLIVETRLEL